MRKLLLGFVVALVPLLGGCGGDSLTDIEEASIAGSYTLRTVNGDTLPLIVVQEGENTIELMEETIAIEENGRFTLDGSVRITEDGVVTTDGYGDAGTWSRSGTSLRLRYDSNGITEVASVDAGRITIALPGISLDYRQ